MELLRLHKLTIFRLQNSQLLLHFVSVLDLCSFIPLCLVNSFLEVSSPVIDLL